MANRKIIIFNLTVVLILISLGCNSEKNDYPEPSDKSINGAFVSRKGTFKFGDKNYSADYGIITVTENRENGRGLIHLPVIRIYARTKNPREPIFGLAGGPGQSNMNWSPIDSLLFNHDFVMVGYRGVDGSTVLDCPEVAEAFKNSGESDLLSEKSLREIGKAWEQSTHRLTSQGIDLTSYTMPETIEDMEAVRNALKYDRINLMSESYGTRIAYIYSLLHPQNIQRSVMIGVNPPGHFIWDSQQTEEQLYYYAQLWSKDSIMLKESPDLIETMRKVLHNLPRKWLFFSIDPGKVKVTAFSLLFQRNTATMVFDSFVAAEQGDYSGIALMSLAFDYTFPSMFVLGDLAYKAISADFDSLQINLIQEEPSDIVLGSSMNKLLWEPLNYGHFPIKLIPQKLRSMIQTDVETLLLSGSVDFSTPAESANELLPYMKNGKQVILCEFGHVGDIRYLRQAQTELLITNYLNTGIIDTSKIEYVPMDFQVSWGFPRIAKVALGVAAIILIALLIGIIWFIRKIKRHRKLKASLVL